MQTEDRSCFSRSTSIICSARSFFDSIRSSFPRWSSISKARLGAVPLIGDVVIFPFRKLRSCSGLADTIVQPRSGDLIHVEYGAGFALTKFRKLSHGSWSNSPFQFLP